MTAPDLPVVLSESRASALPRFFQSATLAFAANDGPPPPWAYGFPSAAGRVHVARRTGGAAAPAPAPDATPRQHARQQRILHARADPRRLRARPTGSPAIIPPCPRSSRTASGPTCAPARSATTRTAKAAPRTPASPACRSPYFIQTMADFKTASEKERRHAQGEHQPDDRVRQGDDRRRGEGRRRILRRDEVDAVDQGRRDRRRCRRRASPAACSCGSTATRRSRSAIGSSRCRTNTEAHRVAARSALGFTAYVPIGSIKKGEALVTSGGGKTTRCAVCHGADLKGLGPVPGHRRPLAELHRAAAVRHAARHAQRRLGRI